MTLAPKHTEINPCVVWLPPLALRVTMRISFLRSKTWRVVSYLYITATFSAF